MSNLEEEIAKRRKRVEAYENREVKPFLRNFVYPVTVTMDRVAATDVANSFPPVREITASFTVKKGTIFYAKRVDCVCTVVGTLLLTTQAASVQLAPTSRLNVIDFVWRVRDSGSDREWSDDWMNSEMLFTGAVNGLLFDDGHIALSGGSEVTVRVGILMQSDGAAIGVSDITQYQLQFAFVGVEVVQ